MTTNFTAGSATGIDLAEIAALAHAAPQIWYGTFQIADGVTDENAVALIEACSPDTVLALIALARATPQHPRPTDDHLWDETLRDRDANAEWADKLAGAIAIHFGVDIGEHSNMNCPWTEALDAIESAPPPAAADAATPQHSVTEQALRFTSDGALAECPCCGSLDVGGAHNTVHCYSCDLTIKRVGPLQNAIDAWNRRAQPPATAATQPEQASALTLPGCLADRLYEAIGIALDRASRAGSLTRMAKWDATHADLRAALAIPASTAASEQQASSTFCGGKVIDRKCSKCGRDSPLVWSGDTCLEIPRATTAADQQGDTTLLTEYAPSQWWLASLEALWGHGQVDQDTRRAAKVACNFAAAVFAQQGAAQADECAANMNGHRFGAHGVNDERQCEWCGAAPATSGGSSQDDAHIDHDPIDELVDVIDVTPQPAQRGPDVTDSEGGHHD